MIRSNACAKLGNVSFVGVPIMQYCSDSVKNTSENVYVVVMVVRLVSCHDNGRGRCHARGCRRRCVFISPPDPPPPPPTPPPS